MNMGLLFGILLFWVSGCKSSPPTDSLFVPGGGVGFLLNIEKLAEDDLDFMTQAIGLRLQLEGISQYSILPLGKDRLRILIPDLEPQKVDSIQKLITRSPRLALSLVDDGKEFFTSIQKKLPADQSIRLAQDTYSIGPKASLETNYLISTSKNKLAKFIQTLAAPNNRKLCLLPAKHGALAYLLENPPTLDQPAVIEADSITNEIEGTYVQIHFKQQFQKAFSNLTRKNVHRRLAILVNDEIRSLPVIQTPISSGQVRVNPSPVTPEEQIVTEAQALAVGLKAWGRIDSLSVIRYKVTPSAQ